MSNKIIIKSGNGAPGNGVLSLAELGFDITNKKVYIGHSDGNVLLNPNQTELSDLGVIATAAELNYVDGVTSNIQTQLDALATDIANRIPYNNDKNIQLASGDDLNNFKTVGLYTAIASIGKNLINSPIESGLKMYVIAGYDGSRRHQFILGQNTSSIYHRMYSGSAWTEWKDLSQTTLEDLGVTATATELNCIDGVTGNIQMQLNNKAEKSISQTISLPVTEWSNLSQTISVSGATANNNIIISPSPESYDAYCEAGVRCSAQASGKLTFICLDVPTVALTVNIGILD